MDPAFPAPDAPRVIDSSDRRATERRQSQSRVFLYTVVVIAVLYLARQVFIPISLAVFFAFLLRPIVSVLERTFLRRIGAVILALAVAIAVVGGGAWSLTVQLKTLATEIAALSGNIERKLRVLTPQSGGSIAIVERTLERIAESGETVENPDLKVRVIPERKTLGERYERIAPTVELMATSFLVIVLVFFLLQDRERLRDKVLRLAGRANLTVTTQAIGETTHRISQYIFTLALLNIGFGVLIGIGLFALDVPHALLCAVLAGVLRFIPYIGAVISAALPTFLAVAVFPDWYTPIVVLVLFLVADQIIGGFIEPLVIGHRVGVSPIALLVSAIFWGWLWGPVGLILATPIAVCMTVTGEFIPALRPFSILFGASADLDDYLSFYNRLITRDRNGALAIGDRYAHEHSMEQAYSDLFIPTLTFAAEELGRKRITPAHDHFVKDVLRESIIRLGDLNATPGEPWQRIVAISVSGQRVSLGTLMLTQLARAEGFAVDYFTELPVDELLHYIRDSEPLALLVSCSSTKAMDEGCELLRTLRSSYPDLFISAGGSCFTENRERALESGASFVPTNLAEAKTELFRALKKGRKKKAS
jgi:predicted PurR-regulated permease PerM